MLTTYVACTMLFVAVAAFPPQYQQIANPRPPYDVGQLNDVTEESNPLEVLLYRTVLQQFLDDMLDKKEQQGIIDIYNDLCVSKKTRIKEKQCCTQLSQ